MPMLSDIFGKHEINEHSIANWETLWIIYYPWKTLVESEIYKVD